MNNEPRPTRCDARHLAHIVVVVAIVLGCWAAATARTFAQASAASPPGSGTPATPEELAAPASASIEKPKPLKATDADSIARQWGIRIESLRLTAAGHMLDFRYTVVDAAKAAPLFVRKTKPVLRDEQSGVVMTVPVPPKIGALRSSNDPIAGRTYFTFFANPGRFIQKHRKVTVTIGEFSVSGLVVR